MYRPVTRLKSVTSNKFAEKPWIRHTIQEMRDQVSHNIIGKV